MRANGRVHDVPLVAPDEADLAAVDLVFAALPERAAASRKGRAASFADLVEAHFDQAWYGEQLRALGIATVGRAENVVSLCENGDAIIADGSAGEVQERAVDVQITRLRRKIEADPRAPRYLQTVRGSGYMLTPD